MKLIFVLQHFIGGEAVEQIASFDYQKLLNRAKEIEDESTGADVSEEDYELDIDDDEDVWVHPTPPNSNDRDVLYYSYDQYADDGHGDSDEILITRIKFID